MRKLMILFVLVLTMSACKKKAKEEENPNSSKLTLKLMSPVNGSTVESDIDVQFAWFSSSTNNAVRILHKVKIVEIIGNESPEQAFKGNKPIFEKDSLIDLNIFLPSGAGASALVIGKRYAWGVTARQKDLISTGGESEVSMFTVVR